MDNMFSGQTLNFIPKVDDSKLGDLRLSFPAICVDASTILWRKNVLTELRELTGLLIIDPATHKLPFPNGQGQSYTKLPYYLGPKEVDRVYFDPDLRLNKLVIPCTKFQIENGAGIVIAPYFHVEDINSRSFNTNLEMLADTIKHVSFLGMPHPIFAVISVPSSILSNRNQLISLKNSYYDQYSKDVGGFIITFEKMDDRDADVETLQGLVQLVFQLSKSNSKVLINHIGGFGEVLAAMGATGYISGICESETFSMEYIKNGSKGPIKNARDNMTYIPEIFDYMNDGDVKKVHYKCSCQSCNGSYPTSYQSKRQHFVLRKMQVADEVSKIPTIELRIEYIVAKLKEARKLAGMFSTDYLVKTKKVHLERWLAVAENAIQLTKDQDDEELLDKILTDIDASK